ncbi:hypothetical protein KIN20_029329, partial [Parelaphostrongylus tenuis]
MTLQLYCAIQTVLENLAANNLVTAQANHAVIRSMPRSQDSQPGNYYMIYQLMLVSTDTEVERIPGWKEKQKLVAKHLLMKYMNRTEEDLAERSQTEGSEREFINAETAALSPNVSTPPYDSFK